MKKLSLLTLCFAVGAALCALSLRAEDKPTVSNVTSGVGATAALPAIDHMVYLSFLPEPAELMRDAEIAGLKVLRLDKTADKVVVSYQYPDGHTATLGYGLLSSAGNGDRVTTRTSERTVVSTERDPEIVYVERPYRSTVVYRDYYDDFWPPLVLGLGLGWATSWHGGGHYHGGYHGGWHGGRH